MFDPLDGQSCAVQSIFCEKIVRVEISPPPNSNLWIYNAEMFEKIDPTSQIGVALDSIF